MNLNKLHYTQKYDKNWEEPYYEAHPLIPRGFMVADGSRLKVEAFPELYEAIGKAYEDSLDPNRNFDPTTFPIPDLRGFISGQGPVKIKPGDTAFIIKVRDESSLTIAHAPVPVGTVFQYRLSDK